MLRNGRYVKEPRPVIGKYYTKTPKSYVTPEGVFIQGLLLDEGAKPESMVSRVLKFLLDR